MPVHSKTLLPSAAALRWLIAEKELKRDEANRAKKARAAEAQRARDYEFLHTTWRAADREDLADRVFAAVANGQFEVLAMRFPSRLCPDRGRAINNSLPHWTATLPGHAAELCLEWEQTWRPRGYRLRAQIIEFPGGLPGDVAVYLNWSE